MNSQRRTRTRCNGVLIAILVAVLLIVTTTAGVALESETESFILTILEGQGRFSIAYKHDGEQTPLFVADDATTSYFKLLLNDRIYVLGDSFTFRQSAETSTNGGSITFTSSRIKVQVSIDISRRTYAIVDVTITNTAETQQNVGLRQVIDTYLGEEGTHFTLPDGTVSSETQYLDIPEYIQSGNGKNTTLYLLYDTAGATVPDRVILANWKRLDDVNWGYTVNTNRTFSYSPYSINDSAVAAYYDEAALQAGSSRNIRIILATQLPGTENAGTNGSGTGTQAPVSAATAATSNAARASILLRVSTINEVLALINELLESERDPTVEELVRIREAVDLLKEQEAQSE